MSLDDLIAEWNGPVGTRAREDAHGWHADREAALPALNGLIDAFIAGELDVRTFRSRVDSFSKSNALWGFQGTALMFFTQLWKAAEESELTAELQAVLRPPEDEADCRERIRGFWEFVMRTRDRAKELGLTPPQAGRVNFFLSFFWEAQDRERWPTYYPNSRDVLAAHGLLRLTGVAAEDYLAYREAMFALMHDLGAAAWIAEALLWHLGTGAEPEPEPPAEPGAGNVYGHYSSQGLIFPDELVTSLALSLLTKRFLILSGISGTGKTKLAQGLATYLESMDPEGDTVEVEPTDTDTTIHLLVTESRLKRGFLYVRQAQEEFLSVPERGTHRTDTAMLPSGEQAEVRVSSINFADATRQLVRVGFRKAAKEWFTARTPGTYVAVDLDDSGRIAGLREVEPEVQSAAVPRRRHEVIPVKSDWTDPRGLLGYHNPITGAYVSTPLIRLMLAAMQDPERPYVAILDEMNLARVEYYLSDFLSASESGEPIPLRPLEAADAEDEDPVPHELAIPPNLSFVGTVNVDETTHAFSPKVLDRANVIEFNDVDVGRALGDDLVAEEGAFRLKSDLSPSWFVEEPGRSKTAKQRAVAVASYTTWLTDVHDLLSRYQLHFGYRVINEVSTYVGHAMHMVQGDPNVVVRAAFDLQLVQKVLPKLAGGRELEAPLSRLLRYCVDGESAEMSAREVLEAAAAALAPGPGQEPVFPRAARKLHRMLTTLDRVGFVAALQ